MVSVFVETPQDNLPLRHTHTHTSEKPAKTTTYTHYAAEEESSGARSFRPVARWFLWSSVCLSLKLGSLRNNTDDSEFT